MHRPMLDEGSHGKSGLASDGVRSTAFVVAHSAILSHDQKRRVIERIVEQVFGIPREELAGVSRGRARVAFARQIGMYVTHVVCGLTLTEVGRAFARDRTTVAHACGIVEDQRDDPHFDHTIERVEQIVRALLEPRPGPASTWSIRE